MKYVQVGTDIVDILAQINAETNANKCILTFLILVLSVVERVMTTYRLVGIHPGRICRITIKPINLLISAALQSVIALSLEQISHSC